MRAVRGALEAAMGTWPDVAPKEMMGCLVYFRGKRFFAFLVTGGVVVTKLPDADRAALAARPGAKPFEMSGRTAAKWVQVPAKKPADLKPLLPYVRKSYDASAPVTPPVSPSTVARRTKNPPGEPGGMGLTHVRIRAAKDKGSPARSFRALVDPEKEFGYRVLEPLIQLRKDGVRKVAKAVGLPRDVYERMPFLGPALAGRIIGEVTPERVGTVRAATTIVEAELAATGASQCMAILHGERVTGMRDGRRGFGQQVEVRCWDSIDARSATPTKVPHDVLFRIADRVAREVPGVVSVTYNVAAKPPSTMEAV